MKKKVLTVCLVAVIAIMAVAGASLAYLTDTDAEDNVFTVGNVTIDLIEQERGENGLQDFTQNKKLLPIVGSAQGDTDQYGQPIAKNYVDKMVTIQNTGSEDAYIRAYFAIPSALDDGYETFNASMNVLHFNFGIKVVDNEVYTTYGVEWNWTTESGKWNYFETTIDGISYNVYFADYYRVLKAGETTEQFVSGVYLDKSFTYKDNAYYAFDQEIDLDEGWDWNAVKCPVFAVAVQAAGFDTADEAFDEALGEQYNPFGGTATNWQ